MVSFTVFKGSKSGNIQQSKTERELGPHDVLVKITHSGLCGTDVHYKGADMGLGHEGVGEVADVGKDVTLFKKGDRAGWGYLHHSCQHCKQCMSGFETFCPERAMYGDADKDQGSMGSHAVWNENFLFAIPENVPSEAAAPLMCGGATVFQALQYGVKSTDRVGVVGLGGLGHLALQYAAKMGCEVVAFSGTDSKKEEATKLGAIEFYATKGVKDLSKLCKKPIDHLLVTTSVQPDWSQFLPIMASRGTIFPLSVSDDDLHIPYMPIVLNGLRIQGSVVAARQVHREMLEFSAVHGIRPIIEKFPMTKEGVEKAFKKLEDGDMRYRGVLVAKM